MQVTNLTLIERAKYCPESFTSDELEDLLFELTEWRDFAYTRAIESPKEAENLISELEENQANPDHADYDDLKEFFNDCVNSLNGNYPCAEAYDLTLRQVICDAISRGDAVDQ